MKVIYFTLTDHELEHLYTIRWTVRRKRRGMTLRLPVFQEEPFSVVEAWRNRDESGVCLVKVDEALATIRFGDQQG